MRKLKCLILHLIAPLLVCAQAAQLIVDQKLSVAGTFILRKDSPQKGLYLLDSIRSELPAMTFSQKSEWNFLSGIACYQLRKYEQAITFLNASEETASDSSRATILDAIGRAYYMNKNLTMAEKSLEKAEATYSKLKIIDSAYVSTLNTLAIVNKEQCEYWVAKRLFKKAVLTNESLTGGKGKQYARVTNGLAEIHGLLGEYPEAIRYFNISLKTKSKGSLDYARTLYKLADFQSGLGSHETADGLIEECLAICTQKKDSSSFYYACLDFKGVLTVRMGNGEAAEILFEESLQRRISQKMQGTAEYALNLLNLCGLYLENGHWRKAEKLINESLSSTEKIYTRQHPRYATAQLIMARILAKNGKFQEAETLFRMASEIMEKKLGKEHIEYFNARLEYARFLRSVNRKEDAVAIFNTIDHIPKKKLRKSSGYITEEELDDQIRLYKNYADEIYSLLWQWPEDDALIKLAYNSQLFYKGYILKQIQHIRRKVAQSGNLRQNFQELGALIRTLQEELLKPDSLQRNVGELENRISTLERVVKSYTILQNDDSGETTLADVFNQLPLRSAVVEYMAFRNKLHGDSVFYGAIVLISETGSSRFVTLGKSDLIMGALPLDVYTTGINLESQSRSVVRSGRSKNNLYNLVWEPLGISSTETSVVYIVPDGILHRISFYALVPPENDTVYLMNLYDLYILGNSREIPDASLTNPESYNGSRVLLVGGLDYGSSSGDITSRSGSVGGLSYYNLKYASGEVDKIRQILSRQGMVVSVLKQNDARKRTVMDTLEGVSGNWKIIHFATHGYYHPDTVASDSYFGAGMTNAGIILSGFNDCLDRDCEIVAIEISNMNLDGVDLVVLSSCESALGNIEEGEGLFGLSRAFRMAGVRNQLVAIHEVNDKFTASFMEQFYKNLAAYSFNSHVAFQKTLKEIKNQPFAGVDWGYFVLME
jgi:CHAT domain-containing protein